MAAWRFWLRLRNASVSMDLLLLPDDCLFNVIFTFFHVGELCLTFGLCSKAMYSRLRCFLATPRTVAYRGYSNDGYAHVWLNGLLKARMNIEAIRWAPGDNHTVILSSAAAEGFTGVVELLVQTSSSIDVNTKDMLGYSPLVRAAHGGHVDMVRALLRDGRVSVSIYNSMRTFLYRRSPLRAAASAGRLDVVKILMLDKRIVVELMDESLSMYIAPLHAAVCHDRFDVVSYFLSDDRLDVNAVDSYGYTALHHAACRRWTSRLYDNKPHQLQCPETSVKMMELLLSCDRLDVNVPQVRSWSWSSFGRTPLYLALACQHMRSIELLMLDRRTIVMDDDLSSLKDGFGRPLRDLGDIRDLLEKRRAMYGPHDSSFSIDIDLVS